MTAPGQGTLVDFQSMLSMSQSFDAQGQAMVRQNQQVENMDQNLRAAYTSDAQVVFNSAVDAWQGHFQKVIESCNQMSQDLNTAAQKYTGTDDESTAAAQALSSEVQSALG